MKRVSAGLAVALAMLAAPTLAATEGADRDEYASRIAKDVIQKMVGTAAFEQLRSTVCTNETARQHLDADVAAVLDCGHFRSAGAARPTTGFSGRATIGDTAAGTWTTKGRENCGRSYYKWVVAGRIGMSEFTDQSGQIDIEITLDFTDSTITTETLSSYHPIDGHHELVGTRWIYTFIDYNHVQVRNLRTGSTFNLTRCD